MTPSHEREQDVERYEATTPVGQTSLAAFEEIIRINLTAVFLTVQAPQAASIRGAGTRV